MKIQKICCIVDRYVGGPTMAVIAQKCPNSSHSSRLNEENSGLE
jgi:hypothetical protein